MMNTSSIPNGSFKVSTVSKRKRNLRQLFIGSPLKHIAISSFACYGIPIPLYTGNGELILLFKSDLERDIYADKLRLIQDDMNAYDPDKQIVKTQEAIAFIARVLESIL